MIYIQVGEKIFKGKTYKALVKRMWETSFDEAINKQNFMFNVEERIKELYNEKVSAEDYQGFIEGLDNLSLIKIIRCKDCENYCIPRHCIAGINIVNPNIVECLHMITKEIKIIKSNVQNEEKES